MWCLLYHGLRTQRLSPRLGRGGTGSGRLRELTARLFPAVRPAVPGQEREFGHGGTTATVQMGACSKAERLPQRGRC